jgi:hypothetical protein
MWFHFFSYKLGRLMLPFALLIAAASCLFGFHSWGQLALWPQIVFYGVALADIAVPQHWRIKRLSSPARTFVVLMAAALCATSIIFLPARRFWTRPTEVRQARLPEFP